MSNVYIPGIKEKFYNKKQMVFINFKHCSAFKKLGPRNSISNSSSNFKNPIMQIVMKFLVTYYIVTTKFMFIAWMSEYKLEDFMSILQMRKSEAL